MAWLHVELWAVGRVSWDTTDARAAIPRQARPNWQHPLLNLVKGLVVFCFVTFGWLFFKLTEFHRGRQLREGARRVRRTLRRREDAMDICCIVSLLRCTTRTTCLSNISAVSTLIVQDCLYAAMLFAIICCSGSPSAFIYFQF